MLVFENVSKKYKDKMVLKDVSFEISEGEFVFLVGPSGAGKSTAMRLILRAEKPTSGNIFFEDMCINRLSSFGLPRYRRQIGVIFQDYKLLNSRTVWENVSFVLEVSRTNHSKIKKNVEEVLDLVGLLDKKKSFPQSLSGGEQQRVSIARALVTDPKFLIADEPTGNLDKVNAWDIMQLLNKINNWGTTVFVTTHDTEIVDSLNKRVLRFEDGRLVRDSVGGYN